VTESDLPPPEPVHFPAGTAGSPTPPGPESAPESAPEPDRLAEPLRQLDGLNERPVAEHVERYEAVHEQLQAALRDVDDAVG
jgi:hypothetical protein